VPTHDDIPACGAVISRLSERIGDGASERHLETSRRALNIGSPGVHYRTGRLIMKQICAIAVSIFVVVGATSARAQEQNLQMPGVGSVSGTGPAAAGSSRPLFTFGGLNVRVWTPVAPPYNAMANRNLAERSIGGAG
jgi:hypothetical protein